jgi:hypothetical protein
MTNMKFLAGTALAIALGVCTTIPASAGSTDPVLVIGQATASGGSPTRVIDLLGAWGFDDVLQIDYPLNIVVSQGTSFVRYPVGDVPVAGTFAGLADGLTIGEISALESAGSPAGDALILRLALHEMSIALPDSFAAGTVEVVLYTSLPGEGTFLSNSAQAIGAGS